MQHTNEQHQNNMDINMMESIGLTMPMMIQQNQMTINYPNNTNDQSMQSRTVSQQQNNTKNMEESDDDHCGDDDMGHKGKINNFIWLNVAIILFVSFIIINYYFFNVIQQSFL